MIVGDIPLPDLRHQLRGPGLRLRTGPVVTCIRSTLDAVAAGIALHYRRHATEPDDGFADFHISIERPRNLRRWLQPQVVFRYDGAEPFAPLPGDQGFPMLEWGLNWCVSSHCHQYVILHAAVIERGGRALLLPAPSGTGKSTLCAGLVYGGGWRLMSDELALIDPTSGRLQALPRPVSLKNASIDVLRRFAPDAVFGAVVRETVKGTVAHVQPPASAVAQAQNMAQPRWIVLPRYEAGAAPQLKPLSPARAFMALVDNAFNYHVHGRRGFNALADMVSACRCLEFRYSDLADAALTFDRLAADA